MNACEKNYEPSLDEIFTEPIVHLVMARDGLQPAAVRAQVEAIRFRLGHRAALHKANAMDREARTHLDAWTLMRNIGDFRDKIAVEPDPVKRLVLKELLSNEEQKLRALANENYIQQQARVGKS